MMIESHYDVAPSKTSCSRGAVRLQGNNQDTGVNRELVDPDDSSIQCRVLADHPYVASSYPAFRILPPIFEPV